MKPAAVFDGVFFLTYTVLIAPMVSAARAAKSVCCGFCVLCIPMLRPYSCRSCPPSSKLWTMSLSVFCGEVRTVVMDGVRKVEDVRLASHALLRSVELAPYTVRGQRAWRVAVASSVIASVVSNLSTLS